MTYLLRLLFLYRILLLWATTLICVMLAFVTIGVTLGALGGGALHVYFNLIEDLPNEFLSLFLIIGSGLGGLYAFGTAIKLLLKLPPPLEHNLRESLSDEHLMLMRSLSLFQPIPRFNAIFSCLRAMSIPTLSTIALTGPLALGAGLLPPSIPPSFYLALLTVFSLGTLPLFVFSPHLQKLRYLCCLAGALITTLFLHTFTQTDLLATLTGAIISLELLSSPLFAPLVTPRTKDVSPTHITYMHWLRKHHDIEDYITAESYNYSLIPGAAAPVTYWDGIGLDQPQLATKWAWAQDHAMDIKATYTCAPPTGSAHNLLDYHHALNQVDQYVALFDPARARSHP